jgi:hypothetical protein
MKHPPIGVTPRHIVNEARLRELNRAIRAYFARHLMPRAEWLAERQELVEEVYGELRHSRWLNTQPCLRDPFPQRDVSLWSGPTPAPWLGGGPIVREDVMPLPTLKELDQELQRMPLPASHLSSEQVFDEVSTFTKEQWDSLLDKPPAFFGYDPGSNNSMQITRWWINEAGGLSHEQIDAAMAYADRSSAETVQAQIAKSRPLVDAIAAELQKQFSSAQLIPEWYLLSDEERIYLCAFFGQRRPRSFFETDLNRYEPQAWLRKGEPR